MKYFTMAEMTNSETAKKRGIKNEPNPTQRANIETLVNELLDKVRERWGKPLRVTSGFRCDELNTAVGGVKKSHHTLGCAADIVAGTPKDRAVEYILANERHNRECYGGYIGPFDERSFHFAVNLRSLCFDEHTVAVFVGSGITDKSVPESEYAETQAKSEVILNTLTKLNHK